MHAPAPRTSAPLAPSAREASLLARRCVERGNLSGALSSVARLVLLLERGIAKAWALMVLAGLYQELGRTAEAVRAARDARSIAPELALPPNLDPSQLMV